MHALVEGGADVRAVDEQGLSALLNAVKVGRFASRLHCCQVLGEHAKLDVKGYLLQTKFLVAMQFSNRRRREEVSPAADGSDTAS